MAANRQSIKTRNSVLILKLEDVVKYEYIYMPYEALGLQIRNSRWNQASKRYQSKQCRNALWLLNRLRFEANNINIPNAFKYPDCSRMSFKTSLKTSYREAYYKSQNTVCRNLENE